MYIAVYTMHVIKQNVDGGATEADGGASAPVGPSVATPLSSHIRFCTFKISSNMIGKTERSEICYTDRGMVAL